MQKIHCEELSLTGNDQSYNEAGESGPRGVVIEKAMDACFKYLHR
jgi:hypothetical protein